MFAGGNNSLLVCCTHHSTTSLLLPAQPVCNNWCTPAAVVAAECDQRECLGSLTCHMFGMTTAKTGDGKTQADMNVCLQSPQVGTLSQ